MMYGCVDGGNNTDGHVLMCCCSNKGVNVELGIPYELWDKPSAEVSKMHRAVSQTQLLNEITTVIENVTLYENSASKVNCCDRQTRMGMKH